MARISRLIVPVLILLAISVRVAAIILLQSHEVPRSTYEHGEIAANILGGRGFSIHFLGADGPTAQQAPLYPALVAIAYEIGGVETSRSLLLIQLTQAALGGVMVMGVIRIAKSIAPGRRWTPPVAGFIVAIHPTLVYAATHIQVVVVSTTLLVWTIAWSYRTGETGRLRDGVITAIFFAFLVLTDPILSLAIIGTAVAVWLGRDGSAMPIRQTFQLTAVVILVGFAGITPWMIRNALVMGELIAIKSTFGYAFWQGNCTLSQGTDKVVRPSVEETLQQASAGHGLNRLNQTLWKARHEAGYIDDIALTKDDYSQLGLVSEPQRSRILLTRALDDLRSHPGRYRDLCLRRLRYFLLFDETNPKSRVWIYRIPHVGLTLLSILGLLLATSEVRRNLTPTIAITAAITLFHTLTIVSARFHIPIEPLLALWSAAALTRFEVLPQPDRSASARHDIKGIRIKDRFAVAHHVR